jgi:hypothetical protein
MKSKFRLFPFVEIWAAAFLPSWQAGAADAVQDAVDFRYAPPEWQTLICLPDDPCKSLVDKSGAFLYYYNQGGREFGAIVAVEVTSNTVWQKQELQSPRVPIVCTYLAADGLKIVEEALAVTDLPQAVVNKPFLLRTDDGVMARKWAHPAGGVDASLGDIALHINGSLQFEVTGKTRRIALALCEGWWDQPGKRVEWLRVEGAAPRMVDTVADIGKNKTAVFWFDAKDTNGDGKIDIQVDAADQSFDKNMILNGLWVFPADAPEDDQALLTGRLNTGAIARLDQASMGGPSRNDLVLVHVTNTGQETRTFEPKLVVDTALGCRLEDQRVVVNNHETVTCSLKMTGPVHGKQVQLESMTVPAGQTVRFFVLYSGGGRIVVSPSTVKEALAARDHAIQYWEKAPLPYGHVQVPDAGVQALVDSSIRNIWQAREIKNGMTAFQVGPTCYRGLWIVDGAFLLEAAAILGAGDQARNGVAYELTHQKSDGRIEVMGNYWKENGIVLWTCARHAQLTQDKAWLQSQWPKLKRIAEYIRTLRQQTLKDNSPLDDGLIPPGYADGGIGGVQYEYTNPYWNLLGLRSFVEAARWLGKTDQAAAWQKEYDDFMAAFRKAAARDMRKDARGNSFLPILMGEAAAKELPQRAQWAFCHAVYPGQIFAKDDPLVAGNMAMLEATEREGMVYGTGWDATGIWNYFASFYGHAWLWQGNGRKAAQILYAYANHAAPVLDWREEQSLCGETFRKVGDMPHNWASAEFIRLTVHLLELDRGHELHLFEGLPLAWTKPGMVTRLHGIATPFGKLTMELRIAADGKTARLRVEPLSDATCQKIIVHLAGWASDKKKALIELDPKSRTDRSIPLAPDSSTANGQ